VRPAPVAKSRAPAPGKLAASPPRQIDLKAFEEQVAALQTGSIDWADIDDE
jgi:hypothetical protein